jgi:hypothetical protein
VSKVTSEITQKAVSHNSGNRTASGRSLDRSEAVNARNGSKGIVHPDKTRSFHPYFQDDTEQSIPYGVR